MRHFRIFAYLFIFILVFQGRCITAQTPGLLCGITHNGGFSGYGTLFTFDPVTNKDSVRIQFTGTPKEGFPEGNLIQYSNGLLYGLSAFGGVNNQGVIFSFNLATGRDSILFSFNGTDGALPTGSLVEASDGMFYGLTLQGGTRNLGVLFRFNPNTGADTVLLNFNDTNGSGPLGSLIQAKDGKLYGMAEYGGSLHQGVLFQFNPVTYKDSVYVNFDGPNYGANPYGSLVQDTDGLLYGMTYNGGFTPGVLFSFNPITGKDTTLVKFFDSTGYYPHGNFLVDTMNGVLYGMNSGGSAHFFGALFSYTPATGKDTVLQRFNLDYGEAPFGTLMQASNGLLYGMTTQGGINNLGELFSFNTTSGQEDTLFAFTAASGYSPYGDLLEAMSVSITDKDTLKCFGDSNAWAKAIVRGAKLPVTYSWNNGATTDSIGGLKAGTYSCAVKDAKGKTFNISVNIIQPPKLYANTFVRNACTGNGDSAWASPFGGIHPYTFVWSNTSTTDTIRYLTPGNYTCTVTDSNGCNAKGIVTIDTALPLKIVSFSTVPTRCNGCMDGSATVVVTGGIPPGDSAIYNYLWTYGPDSATVHGVPAGYEKVCITSYYGCDNPGVCDSVLVLTGINSIADEQSQVKIYPVPGNGNVTIVMPGNGYERLVIIDALGRDIYTEQLDAEKGDYTMQANLSAQANGVYIVQLFTKQGTVTRKLVIEK